MLKICLEQNKKIRSVIDKIPSKEETWRILKDPSSKLNDKKSNIENTTVNYSENDYFLLNNEIVKRDTEETRYSLERRFLSSIFAEKNVQFISNKRHLSCDWKVNNLKNEKFLTKNDENWDTFKTAEHHKSNISLQNECLNLLPKHNEVIQGRNSEFLNNRINFEHNMKKSNYLTDISKRLHNSRESKFYEPLLHDFPSNRKCTQIPFQQFQRNNYVNEMVPNKILNNNRVDFDYPCASHHEIFFENFISCTRHKTSDLSNRKHSDIHIFDEQRKNSEFYRLQHTSINDNDCNFLQRENDWRQINRHIINSNNIRTHTLQPSSSKVITNLIDSNFKRNEKWRSTIIDQNYFRSKNDFLNLHNSKGLLYGNQSLPNAPIKQPANILLNRHLSRLNEINSLTMLTPSANIPTLKSLKNVVLSPTAYLSNEDHWEITKTMEKNKDFLEAATKKHLNKIYVGNKDTKKIEKGNNFQREVLINKNKDGKNLNICFNCVRSNHKLLNCRYSRISDEKFNKVIAKANENLKIKMLKSVDKYKCCRNDLLICNLREAAPNGYITQILINTICDRCSKLGHTKNLCKNAKVDFEKVKSIYESIITFKETFFVYFKKLEYVDFSRKFEIFNIMDSIETNVIDPVSIQLQSICIDGIIHQKHLIICSNCAELGHKSKKCAREKANVKLYLKMLLLVDAYYELLKEKEVFKLPSNLSNSLTTPSIKKNFKNDIIILSDSDNNNEENFDLELFDETSGSDISLNHSSSSVSFGQNFLDQAEEIFIVDEE